jgi:uncharacterized protein (TIGR03437 family)
MPGPPLYALPRGTVRVAEIAPAIVTQGPPGNFCVAANQDGLLNSKTFPASVGDTLTLYLTGQGPVDTAVPDGEPPPANTVVKFRYPAEVRVNDVSATVLAASLAPGLVGLAQVTIKVPDSPLGYNSRGERYVKITVRDQQSGSCRIAIRE